MKLWRWLQPRDGSDPEEKLRLQERLDDIEARLLVLERRALVAVEHDHAH